MTQQQITELNTTKTEKIRLLLELGLTRTQVAAALGINYGFVQNVYARIYGVSRTNNRGNVYVINRSFGIELEMYNVNAIDLTNAMRNESVEFENENYNHTTRSHWKGVRDRSINGTNGIEVVSPILQGENGMQQVKSVCKALNNVNAKVNKSCGFHVHFSAEDFTIKQWRNLFINFAMFENHFDSMMPVSRRDSNNRYCKSIKTKVLNNVPKINAATRLRAITKAIGQDTRYVKLNVESFWRHGTVEFRHHSGTVDFNKISNWIEILNSLIEYSATNRATSADDFYQILNAKTKRYYEARKEALAA
ncbi:MAG: amidoligase family protein [Candidatus Kapabacteria bacterium]|nr:amidoligase family protein [Candidatus Kapabacteria bacterium]